MNDGMLFGYADEPWLPTLLDIERMKNEGTDADKTYWRKFGWDALEVPETDTEVKARMGVLNTRFLANYGWRMLSYETMEQWQVRLQERFDATVDKYERAYRLYAENKDAMMDDALPGAITTIKGAVKASGSDTVSSSGSDINTQSGSDSTSGTRKHSDTPDSLINASDSYAGTLDKDSGSVTYGRKDTRSTSGNGTTSYGRVDTTDTETKQVYTGGRIMEAVNATIAGWMDVDTAFINEFENLFSNILWS